MVAEREFGPDHPEVACTLEDLGAALLMQGDLDRSEEVRRRALRISESMPSPSPEPALAARGLGETLAAQGRYAEAQEMLERAIAGLEAVLPPAHPQLIKTIERLADQFEERGDQVAADAARERVRRMTGGPEPD